MLNAVSDKPMYEQIKEAIRSEIFNGRLPNNAILPSVRQLAADLNVSAITTKRAYSDLEHEGLIYTSPGKGTFVRAPDKNLLAEQFRERQLTEFKECAEKLLDEGFSREELKNEIDKIRR